MANGGKIEFGVGFKVDKTGLTEIKKELAQIQQMTPTDLMNMNKNITSINQARSELGKLQYDVTQIQAAFNNAFDTTTGVTNIVKLNQSLQKLDLSRISQNFNLLGTQGQQAFTKIAAQAMTANLKFKETNNTLDKMARTLGNTLKWSISSKAINTFTGAIQQAWGYVQHLDTSLNDIRIVTGKSAEEMDNFAKKANDAAQSLGSATTDYTEAALIYYQQGLSDEESNARAETTIKAANVTGQSAQQVSEELTAVWNGYKVSAEETELYVDKLAATAATTAADLEELSTGMSKVASAAANMGVDVDQLNAQLATIISVTRQAPESVGTALKTIYARIEDLKLGGEDEDGTKLGQVSSGLESMGIEIKNSQGDLRNLGEVIEEIGGKWDSWTESQQAAIAQLVAGKRQYNNLIALFDNWDMYNDALMTSQDSIGTLQEQQNIYMESTAAHLQQLKTQWEDLYDSLIDQDDINGLTDLFTGILDKVTNFVDAIGGGKGALLGLGAVATQVFNRQISQGLESVVTKFQNTKSNLAQINAELKTTQLFAQNMGLNPELTNQLVALKQSVQEYYDVMSQEEIQQSNELIKEVTDLAQIKQGLEQNIEKAKQFTSVLAAANKETKGTQNRIATVDFTNSNGKTAETIRTMDQQYEKLSGTLTTLITQYQQLQTAVNAYKEAEKNGEKTGAVQKTVNKALREYEETLNRIKDVINASGNQELIKEYNTLSATLEKLTADYKAYNTYSTQTPGKKAAMTRAITSDLNAEKVALNNVKQGLEEEAKAFQKAYSSEQTEKLANVTKGIQDQETALRGLYTAFDTRQFISGITSIVSGLSSIGLAYSSLKSLNETWADDTTSTLDKVMQSFISIGMLFPAITTSLQGLNNAKILYNTLTGAQVIVNGKLFASQTAINTVSALEAATLEAATKELIEQGVALNIASIRTEIQSGKLSANTAQLILNTQAVKSNALAQQSLGASIGSVGSGTQGLVKGASLLGGKLTALGSAATGSSAAIGALGAGVAIAASVVAVLAAAVVGAGLAYKAYRNHLESAAAASKEAADKAKEQTEALKEQKDVVNEVTEAYKELQDQYDVSQVYELRQSVYELCKQHGLQDLAVKALIADYDELNKIMDEAQAKSNKEYGQAITDEQNKIKDSTLKGIQNELKWTESAPNNGIALKGYNSIGSLGISNAEVDLLKGLSSLGITVKDDQTDRALSSDKIDSGWVLGASISMDELNEVALNHYEELMTLLEGSGTKASKRLLELLETQSESYERNQELLEESKSQIVNSYLPAAEKVSSTQDYENIKTQVMNDSQLQASFTDVNGVLDEEALENYVDQWMQGIDSIKQYAQNADLAEAIVGKFGDSKTKEEIESQLEDLDLDDVTKNFIQDHVNLLPAYEGINDFVEHFKDEIELLQQQDILLHINTVFDGEKSNSFKEEDIAALYEETDFATSSGISQQEFEAMDFEEQKAALLDYYTIAGQKETEYRDNVSKTSEAKQQQIQQELDSLNQLQKSYSADVLEKSTNGYLEHILNQVNEVRVTMGEGELSLDEFRNALNELSNVDSDKEIENISKAIYDAGITSKSQVVHLQKLAQAQKAYENITKDFNKEGKSYKNLLDDLGQQQKELGDIQESTKDTVVDWSKAYETAISRMEDVSDSLDDIQSAYKSLTSITEEYNETGALSLDNLQTILEMDDQYLAALELENGQMSVNGSTLEALTNAKLDEAEATAVEEAMAKLLALQNQEVEATTNGVGIATQEVGVQVTDLITILQQGKQAWNEYWAAEANDLDIADKNWQTTTDSLYNRLSLIQSVRDQIGSGNFNTTMNGVSSDSSSSSSSSDEPDTKDYLENEYDLYEGINTELEKMESILGRIENIDDHSWGASAIEALNEETELLQDELELYEQKASIQQQDLAQQKASLESQGITFTEDGSAVSNAKEKLDTLYAEYNAMVDKYNAMSKSEQDDYEDTLNAKKDAIDDLEDAIDDYESLYSDYQDTLDTIQDKEYELISKEVEKFNYTVDIHLELDDAKKEWNDFWYDVIKDVDNTDFGDLEDKLSSLSGKIEKSLSNLTTLVGFGTNNSGSSEIGELTKHLTDTTAEVWKQINSATNGGIDSIFKNDSALSKENLTDYRDKLISAMTEAKNALDDISESYLGMLDAAQDKIDEHVDGLNAVGDQINHNIKLIQLRKWDLSDSKRSDALNKQYEQQYKNNQRLLNTNKQSVDFWKDEINNYSKLLAKTEEGSEEYKTYTQAMEKATENYRDAVDDLNKSLEQSLEDLQNWYENEVAIIQKTLDESLSNGLGLETMEEEWTLINEYASYYLDNVERALELESYTNDLNDAADAIGLSAENQAKLNKFREDELKKLNEKTKLTQYDIDESRARLEVMKQEMALEDERNNKSKMRLRRDNQGNYNYQYVGDQEAEDKAERGLLTAKKEWYELVKKRWTETTQYNMKLSKQQITLQNEWEQALANGQTERANKLEELMLRNEKELRQAYAESEKNRQDLYSGTAQYFKHVQDANILPDNDTTVRKMITSWAGSDDKTSFTAAVKKAMNDLKSKIDEFKAKQSALVKESGTAWGSIRDKGIDPTKESLDKLVDSEDELKDGLEKTNDELKEQEANLKNAEAAYESFKDSVVAAVKAANDALETLSKTTIKVKDDVSSVADAAGSSDNSNSTNTNTTSTDTSAGTTDSGTSGGNEKSKNSHGYRVYTDPSGVAGKYYATDLQGHLIGNLKFVDLDTIRNWLIQHGYHYSDGFWNVKANVKEFKSGGYTGEWDDSGKLAVLHQKELVLNESDTSNLLKAVDSIRELTSNNVSIDVNAIAAGLVQTGAVQAQMLAQVGQGLLSAMSSVVNTNNQNYSSNMTVNADFSGVRSADAIYQALRELENYGAQQAYSTSPFANKAY